MRLLLVAVLCGLAFLPALAVGQAAGVSSVTTLAQLKDHFRPLLIFAPTADDARLVEQVRVISANSKEAADRQLLAVGAPEREDYPTGHRLLGSDAAEARRRFHVAPGEFVVVLVGKDGGEKLRSNTPLSFEKLREVIDAMPMRRDEVR